MKRMQFFLAVALAMAAGSFVAYGSGTSKGEEDKMKQYPPGSSTAFSWVSVEEGLVEMKRLKMPGMVYFYNASDNMSAYMWEVKVFDCPQFRTLKDRFIIMRIDSTDKVKDPQVKLPKGKTGVAFLDFTGKKMTELSRPASPTQFAKVSAEAAARNEKVKKEEAAKGGESEKKDEKTGKTEEKKDEGKEGKKEASKEDKSEGQE